MKAYEEAFRYHQNELRTFCASRHAGFMTVCSDERIEQMLFGKAAEVGIIT